MANVAQLVRALVCGTRCREFESHHSPQMLQQAKFTSLSNGERKENCSSPFINFKFEEIKFTNSLIKKLFNIFSNPF